MICDNVTKYDKHMLNSYQNPNNITPNKKSFKIAPDGAKLFVSKMLALRFLKQSITVFNICDR